MAVDDYVLVRGLRDTRGALARWNDDPWPVLRRWFAGALAVAIVLLCAVWFVASTVIPDPTGLNLPGLTSPAGPVDVAYVVFRNSLVLALHAMACVAGFIAGSSLPQVAEGKRGLWRKIHDVAGPLAIGFVCCATLFSLGTQAYVLGGDAATLAQQFHVSPALLLACLSLHAIPELFALFLPLAAWIIASRRGRWEELLAATFVTTAISVPVLLLAASIEVWVTPRLLLAVVG